MFFSGDPTIRKRVDLGGRSSKERDRQVLLEQMRQDRKRRQGLRQQNAAAIKIQKFYRGRKTAEIERSKVREQFILSYGQSCENVDQKCFTPESKFLRQLLFFFTASNKSDRTILVHACRLLLHFMRVRGDKVYLFAGPDYSSKHPLVDNRVKKLALLCLKALYEERNELREQLLLAANETSTRAVILLETVASLANPDLPWACKVVDSLVHKKVFVMLRSIIFSGLTDVKTPKSRGSSSCLENVVFYMVLHVGQHPCNCSPVDPKWCFSSQILSIPFIWHHLPYFRELFTKHGLGKHYIHQMASFPSHANVIPSDLSNEHPGYACLLGNLLEAAGDTLSEPSCSREIALNFVNTSTFLLELLPTTSQSALESPVEIEDSMDEDFKPALDRHLERQITSAIDSRLLQHLVNVLFRDTMINGFLIGALSGKDVEAIIAVCTFLHVTFNTLPLERIMTGLAYRTELVHYLWNYIKQCHENQRWPVSSSFSAYAPGDAPGWLLPLAVFCPVYKHMLMIVDNEEFYEQEKPLSQNDIRSLVVILRQALWQLLWVVPSNNSSSINLSVHKKLSLDVIKQRVKVVASELLSQLHDWNNRRAFTSADDFHAQEAISESFVSQALLGNSKASEILRQAPFLVPLTSRVRIFASQLAASKQNSGAHPTLARSRCKIRRDRILEDAFSQLSSLSEDELKGPIRVSFVNELGVEEAGIDGGGIFKDFMENITQTAFDVQYGLFKETADHLLYPNPGSGLIHEQHLQYFHFLGSLLGKAMYEGILVDIPFATFFLSKLKQKYNYLNDLPSLDPELYRHLLFLKHYAGDVSELELYFVIVNNEYGEQTEEELLPGGKDIRVTNDNVITFIHLVANHRLNYQIRNQSKYFLRGFQQLIQKEWIDMFNEHELQLLISGSLESFDVDDLCSNAHYSGGYHPEHPVIKTFWEVLKGLSLEHQKKFLKFVTGCSRGPLLGFKYLEPKFCIQRTAPVNGTDEDLDRLPTSATCMNLLKLPPYRSKEQLQSKLIYAINSEAGFDLS